MFTKLFLAGGQGFEPQYPGPKPGVLPLDDPPLLSVSVTRKLYQNPAISKSVGLIFNLILKPADGNQNILS